MEYDEVSLFFERSIEPDDVEAIAPYINRSRFVGVSGERLSREGSIFSSGNGRLREGVVGVDAIKVACEMDRKCDGESSSSVGGRVPMADRIARTGLGCGKGKDDFVECERLGFICFSVITSGL